MVIETVTRKELEVAENVTFDSGVTVVAQSTLEDIRGALEKIEDMLCMVPEEGASLSERLDPVLAHLEKLKVRLTFHEGELRGRELFSEECSLFIRSLREESLALRQFVSEAERAGFYPSRNADLSVLPVSRMAGGPAEVMLAAASIANNLQHLSDCAFNVMAEVRPPEPPRVTANEVRSRITESLGAGLPTTLDPEATNSTLEKLIDSSPTQFKETNFTSADLPMNQITKGSLGEVGLLEGGNVHEMRPYLFMEKPFLPLSPDGRMIGVEEALTGSNRCTQQEIWKVQEVEALRLDPQFKRHKPDDAYLLLNVRKDADGNVILPIPTGLRVTGIELMNGKAYAFNYDSYKVERSCFGTTRLILPDGVGAFDGVRVKVSPGSTYGPEVPLSVRAALTETMPRFGAPMEELMTKLVECARTGHATFAERTNFVVEAFRSLEPVYTLDSRVAQLLAASGENRLAFLNGLGAGSCNTMSFQLCSLLNLAGIPAYVTHGQNTQPGSDKLKEPGHAQVVVLTPHLQVLDPTLWTKRGVALDSAQVEESEWTRLQGSIAGLSPEEAFVLGRNLREKMLVPAVESAESGLGHEMLDSYSDRAVEESFEARDYRLRKKFQEVIDEVGETGKLASFSSYYSEVQEGLGFLGDDAAPEESDDLRVQVSLAAIDLLSAPDLDWRERQDLGKRVTEAMAGKLPADIEHKASRPDLALRATRALAEIESGRVYDDLHSVRTVLDMAVTPDININPNNLKDLMDIAVGSIQRITELVKSKELPDYNAFCMLPDFGNYVDQLYRHLHQQPNELIACQLEELQKSFIALLRESGIAPMDVLVSPGGTIRQASVIVDSPEPWRSYILENFASELFDSDGLAYPGIRSAFVDLLSKRMESSPESGSAVLFKLGFSADNALNDKYRLGDLDFSEHRERITRAFLQEEGPYLGFNFPDSDNPVSKFICKLSEQPALEEVRWYDTFIALRNAGALDLDLLKSGWNGPQPEAAIATHFVNEALAPARWNNRLTIDYPLGTAVRQVEFPDGYLDILRVVAPDFEADGLCTASLKLIKAAEATGKLSAGPMDREMRTWRDFFPAQFYGFANKTAGLLDEYPAQGNAHLLGRLAKRIEGFEQLAYALQHDLAKAYVDARDRQGGKLQLREILARVNECDPGAGTSELGNQIRERFAEVLKGSDFWNLDPNMQFLLLKHAQLIIPSGKGGINTGPLQLAGGPDNLPNSPYAADYSRQSLDARTWRRRLAAKDSNEDVRGVDEAREEIRRIYGSLSVQELVKLANGMVIEKGNNRAPGANDNFRDLEQYQLGQPLDIRRVHWPKSDLNGEILLKRYGESRTSRKEKECLIVDVEALDYNVDNVFRYLAARAGAKPGASDTAPLRVEFHLRGCKVAELSWAELQRDFTGSGHSTPQPEKKKPAAVELRTTGSHGDPKNTDTKGSFAEGASIGVTAVTSTVMPSFDEVDLSDFDLNGPDESERPVLRGYETFKLISKLKNDFSAILREDEWGLNLPGGRSVDVENLPRRQARGGETISLLCAQKNLVSTMAALNAAGHQVQIFQNMQPTENAQGSIISDLRNDK